MKILEKHILSEFLRLLVMALAGFIVLFITVDLFENVDTLMAHKVPLLASFVFFIYKLPFIIGQVSPVAVLVAVLLSLGILSKHGEITAMKAGGVRLLRTIAPLLAAGLIISLSIILMNEYVTPAAQRKVDTFKKQWFGVQGGTFGKEGLWVKSDGGILNVRHIDFRKNALYGITYYELRKPFAVTGRVETPYAFWKDGRWVADVAAVWTFTQEGEARADAREQFVLQGLADPEDLVNLENFQQNMSFVELNYYIGELYKDGYETTKYTIDLWSKISFPLVNFIMVLVGIPFALKTGRHSGIAAGVGLSIVIAFSYWMVYALTRSLGQGGMVPPLMAAFFPDILFLAIGSLMYGYVKQ
jgi:lipopolysaccharide export system permease protein